MPDMTREEAAKILRSGFGKALLQEAMRVSTAIYWGEAVRGQTPRIRNSGTLVFLDAGQGPFAVSAHHVIEVYRQALAQEPGLVCYVSNEVYDPLAHIIAADPRHDLVTLSLTESVIRVAEKKIHVHPREWPPRPPQQGRGVFFGGYRGQDREQLADRLGLGFMGGVGTATAVTEDRVTIQFEREEWVHSVTLQEPAPNSPWGGASGGPVFALVQNGIMSWQLAGIISEFSADFEILIAHSLRHFRPDGHLAI